MAPPLSKCLWVTTFLALSYGGLLLMRIQPIQLGIPLNFEQQVQTGKLLDGVTAHKTSYTRIPGVDDFLSALVLAFSPGPLNLDSAVWLQQVHFLFNCYSVLVVWNVEAFRRGNRGKIISFPAMFAIFYQTIAGAFVMPIYFAIWVATIPKSRPKADLQVPLSTAKAILPGTLLTYLAPTILMYTPISNIVLKQNIIAAWQFTPCFVGLNIMLLSRFMSSDSPAAAAPAAKGTYPGFIYIRQAYAAAFLVCLTTHIAVIYWILTSPDPRLTLVRVFVPNLDTRLDNIIQGLHYIFQWDWWFVYVAYLLWASYEVAQTWQRSNVAGVGKPDANAGFGNVLKAMGLLFGSAVVLGPGAPVAAVWWWKEGVEQGTHGKLRSA